MNNFKFIVIVNFIVQVVFISCVAAVAVDFNRPTLLWWWLLAPFSVSRIHQRQRLEMIFKSLVQRDRLIPKRCLKRDIRRRLIWTR